MKIIIQDYTTAHSSESRLLYTELQSYENIEAFFWDVHQNKSSYDLMDSINPDFIVLSALGVNKDLLHYFTYNNIGKIVVLKIPNGTTQEQIQVIDDSEFVKKHVCLAISEKEMKNVRTVNLNPCVDTNIPDIPMKNHIPLCIVANKSNIHPFLLKLSESFHVMSYEKNDLADIIGPNISLCGLYHNYDQIVFDGITDFKQPFFDALYRSSNVTFCSDSEGLVEKGKILFGQNLNIANKNIDRDSLLNRLKEKHLPQNRVKQLLSQMPIDQSIFTEVNK